MSYHHASPHKRSAVAPNQMACDGGEACKCKDDRDTGTQTHHCRHQSIGAPLSWAPPKGCKDVDVDGVLTAAGAEVVMGAGCATVAKGPTAWGGAAEGVFFWEGRRLRKRGLTRGVKKAVVVVMVLVRPSRGRRRSAGRGMVVRFSFAL